MIETDVKPKQTRTSGKYVQCPTCDGHGVVDSWVNIPDECKTCGGSGTVWQYASGLIAKWRGGPFV